jgi:hypothetical protein
MANPKDHSNIVVGVSTPGGGGVLGPTSKLSSRVPAQMGRRETEHEGGKKQAKGKPAASVWPFPGRRDLVAPSGVLS